MRMLTDVLDETRAKLVAAEQQVSALQQQVAALTQDAECARDRANQEIARRERAEVAYTQSEQKRLALIDAKEAAEQQVAALTQQIGELIQSAQARTSERDQAREATQTQAAFYEQRLETVEQERTCHWAKEDDPDDGRYYDTQCGEAYMVIEGSLDENRHRYCPFCGGRITAVLAEGPAPAAKEGQSE